MFYEAFPGVAFLLHVVKCDCFTIETFQHGSLELVHQIGTTSVPRGAVSGSKYEVFRNIFMCCRLGRVKSNVQTSLEFLREVTGIGGNQVLLSCIRQSL